MALFQRGLIIGLVLAICVVVSNGSVHLGRDDILGTAYFTDDELEMMEPRIVAEPEDGSTTWWYTPSRKAHMHKHRYSSAIRNLQNEYNKKKNQIKQGEDMRLPGDIIPITYNVRMLPFVELIASGNYTTDGYVEIVVECVRATQNISINSAELDIKRSTISVYVFWIVLY